MPGSWVLCLLGLQLQVWLRLDGAERMLPAGGAVFRAGPVRLQGDQVTVAIFVVF